MFAELLLELAYFGVELGRLGRSGGLLALQGLHALFRRWWTTLARRVPVHELDLEHRVGEADGPTCR